MNWRRNFWRWVRRSVDEGALLPRWAIVVRWILFPMDSAYWHLASTRGYNPLRDTWLIDGMEFTGAAMHALVNSHGQVFRITRTGQTVTLERVQNEPGDMRLQVEAALRGAKELQDGIQRVRELLDRLQAKAG